MRVGDKLAELLMENGVEYVYGVPGGQTLPLYEGIRKLDGKINHVLMRDERSAGYAADAYARLTGRTGVCDGTVGPGATNMVSPLAEAYCSSIPLIAIISDISTTWEHRRTRGNASQAMYQLEMFQTVSKWQVRVTDPSALESTIETAFRIATTGKPGPVVVSIPDNVGSADFAFRDGKAALGAAYPGSRSAPDPDGVKRACQMILDAKKPLMVVGGGAHISGCGRQVRDLAEHLQTPIITTISGKGIIEETHPLSLGVTGTFGSPVARTALQDADLVFFIGSKAGQLTTFNYRLPARNIPIIHLDSDPEEIGRNFAGSVPLVGDAALGLDAIIAALGDLKPDSQWDPASYKQKREQWFQETTETHLGSDGRLRPQAVMAAVSKVLTDDDLVVCDASLCSGWAASLLQFSSAGRRFMAPRGLAGLGWGAPAAVGAALATRKQTRIFQFSGDGGFGYSVQELEVMKRLELPVVCVVLNNDTLGWIKHVQRDHYAEKYISTDFSHIDYKTVAKGFGARSYTANTIDELQQYLEQESSPKGPALIEVISDPWESPIVGL